MESRTRLLVLTPVVTAIFVFGLVLVGGVPHLGGAPTSSGLRANVAAPVPVLPTSPGHLVSVHDEATSGAAPLHWVPGTAYPTVNGKATPPPLATPYHAAKAPPPSTGGHWYAGSVYNGANVSNTWVLSEISVPSASTPDTTEFYYVIMSIWDNAGSYDQVGFTDDDGVWGLAYSYTTGPCTSVSYVYNPDVMSLSQGQEYLFAITSAEGPGVWFEVSTVAANGAVTLIWYLHALTGATSLEQTNFYCGYYDYTDYEEVYGTTSYSQPDPYGAPIGLTWFFHENCNGAGGCNTWTTWSGWKSSNAPGITSVTIGKFKGNPELVTITTTAPTKGNTPG